MGQEIVYCSKCQSQVRGADFDRGTAFRIDQLVYCGSCASDGLYQLSPDKRQAYLKQAERKKRESAASDTSTIPRPPSTRRMVGMTGPSHKAILLPVMAAGLALIALLFWGLSGKATLPDDPTPSKTAPALARDPVRPAAPPPSVAPAEAPKRPPAPAAPKDPAPPVKPKAVHPAPTPAREAEGLEALRKLRDWEKSQPKDIPGAFDLAQKAVWAAEGTSLENQAKEALERYRKLLAEFFEPDLAALDHDVRTRCDKEEFGKALDLLAKASKAHENSQWGLAISKRKRDVSDRAYKLFDSLKEKALDAQSSGATQALEVIRERVAKWEIPELLEAMEKLSRDP